MPRRSCMRSGGAAATSSADAHGANLDAVVLEQFDGHVEIHIVAGIVAIEKQHALAAMHRLRRAHDDVGRRRRKHLPQAAPSPMFLPMKP